MAEIITYNNPNTGNPNQCFCQMKFEDGLRILISQSREGIKIFKLSFGVIPRKILFQAGFFEIQKHEKFIQNQSKRSLLLDYYVDTIKQIKNSKQFYRFLEKGNIT